MAYQGHAFNNKPIIIKLHVLKHPYRESLEATSR